MYDYDAIVIGAGPAGMATATRLRWVKTSLAVPASVVLLDPAGTGGLAAMGKIALSGPGFSFDGAELAARVRADIESLEIPVIREAATAVARDGDLWTVRTATRTLRGLAVILATGLRCLSNEAELMRAGRLGLLSGGYTRAADRFRHWSHHDSGRRLVLIGGEPLADDLPRYRAVDAGRNQITALIEPRQRVLGYRHLDSHVVIDTDAGEIACDMILVDYHSLELAPPTSQLLPAAWRTEAGFPRVGAQGSPALPGLYAAGDGARLPSMCVKALAEGAEAGFNAYDYIFRRKFDSAPHLFAFYPSSVRPDFAAHELPPIDPRAHVAVGLTAASRFTTPAPLTPEALPTLLAEIHAKTATVHLTGCSAP
jgi:thioredoxin reductase